MSPHDLYRLSLLLLTLRSVEQYFDYQFPATAAFIKI